MARALVVLTVVLLAVLPLACSMTEVAAGGSGNVVVQTAPDREVLGEPSRVAVSMVMWLTLAMAAASGFGAVPFFFVELDARWAGLCNGLAAGVMLAASFDLVQEGEAYGGGSGQLVVLGILGGAIFIWLCKKFLEQYGEVSMLDIKGADAQKAILVVGIMTLHSFGEGAGVGVSYAGPKGLSQGLLVTLAIAVHNIPEGLAVSMVLLSRGVHPRKAMFWSIVSSLPQPIVAVPAFLCTGAFERILPFCTGFAAGCMIWIVVAEVLPDAFKEAPPSQVASSATIAVAFMETLTTVFEGFSHGQSSGDIMSGYAVSLLFGLGPLLGGLILITFSLAFSMPHPLLTGVATGIAFRLAVWRPWHLIASSKIGFLVVVAFLAGGAALYHILLTSLLRLVHLRKGGIAAPALSPGLSISTLTLQSFAACGAVFFHGFAEGLALGVAAPKAYGLGRHMVIPVSLHGLPRGAAVASCVFAATNSWRSALVAAAVTGFAGPIAAIAAITARIDYSGLDYPMVLACGALVPAFCRLVHRSARVNTRRTAYGVMIGVAFASVCLMSTRLICLHTPYCNSAPEAVT